MLNYIKSLGYLKTWCIFAKENNTKKIEIMKSEVEINKELIQIGDKLIYVNDCSCESWIVSDLFEGGFQAVDDYETKDFMFDELQIGWTISDKSKNKHQIEDRFIYS